MAEGSLECSRPRAWPSSCTATRKMSFPGGTGLVMMAACVPPLRLALPHQKFHSEAWLPNFLPEVTKSWVPASYLANEAQSQSATLLGRGETGRIPVPARVVLREAEVLSGPQFLPGARPDICLEKWLMQMLQGLWEVNYWAREGTRCKTYSSLLLTDCDAEIFVYLIYVFHSLDK